MTQAQYSTLIFAAVAVMACGHWLIWLQSAWPRSQRTGRGRLNSLLLALLMSATAVLAGWVALTDWTSPSASYVAGPSFTAFGLVILLADTGVIIYSVVRAWRAPPAAR